MSKKILLFYLAIIAFITMSYSYAKEPKNLDAFKMQLIKYHDSGEYQKDQAKVIEKAMQYLKTRLKNKNSQPLAIVLDIDETALSNYENMRAMQFGGSLQQIMTAEGQSNDKPILPTLELYRYAKANHVAVFFITGRPESYCLATEKNLLNAGYKDWNGLACKAEDYKEKSPAFYKIHARTLIEKQGYDIVLNIGDQQSDLSGGHADKTFKLPNPYYFIP